ncbi:MAG: NfeD family protein [Armatimonadota bacterium]
MGRIFAVVLLVFTICTAYPAFPSYAAQKPVIYTVRIDGAIDPAIARYVERASGITATNNAQAMVVLLETPGGLDDSMRKIVQTILGSRTPVVVYVWPQGARAASAGAIITLAANVAAMSPGTAIGAAHPVSIGGGEKPDATMMKKIENDAAAYARDIAKKRGRNVQWAEMIVRESVSSTSTEALQKNVIDLIADDLPDLLRKIDNRRVETSSGETIIRSADADVREIKLTSSEQFLHLIANPNLAYLFMMIAIYGIIFELSNPGAILPGVAGGIALILALFSFAVLPVNLVGILLIILGIALLIIDLFAPSHGVLTIGGLVSFVIGSLVMFDTPQSPVYQISITLVITTAALTGAFFIYAVGAGIRAQSSKVMTGSQGMVGLTAIARTDLNPTGKVFVEGEWWNAEVEGDPVLKGETVRIIRTEKLRLIVKKETTE